MNILSCRTALRPGAGLCCLLFLLAAAGARAEEIGAIAEAGLASAPIDVCVNSQATVSSEHNAQEKIAGDGQTRSRSVAFSLHLNNRQLDAVSDISCKVYVVGYSVGGTATGKAYTVMKVLEKGQIQLSTGAQSDVDLGTVEFKQVQHLAAKGNGVSYAGDFYAGEVLEVYVAGKLVDVVVEGPVRKAYESYPKAA